MRKEFFSIVSTAVLLSFLCPNLSAGAHRGDWPTYRGDGHRTGRSPLPARIVSPEIAWRYGLQEWEARLLLTPIHRERSGGIAIDPHTSAPGIEAGEWINLAGDGNTQRVQRTNNTVYAKLLPDVPGYQKFHFQDGMAMKTRPDGPKRPVAHGTLYRYDRGREEVVWTTGPEEQCEMPLCAVADMNCDGQPELVVCTWYRVMVFDARTGEKVDECRWHKGRNYGHFEVRDLNGDGFPECIVLADFMIHMNVLENREGKLSLKWRKEVEFQLFGKRKALRPGPTPLVDLDGDGRLELLVNLFNDSGDERWHVTVYDAFDGTIQTDIPDKFASGIADLNGDDLPEVLLTPARGLAIQKYGELFVGNWTSGSWQTWPLPEQGRWAMQDRELTPLQATCAAEGRRTALVTLGDNADTVAWIVTAPEREADAPSGEGIVGFLWNGRDRWEERVRCQLPKGTTVAFSGTASTGDSTRNPTLIFQTFFDNRDFSAAKVRGAIVSLMQPTPVSYQPDVPIVIEDKDSGVPLVAVATSRGTVHAIEPRPSNRSPQLRWKRPGRSQTADMGSFFGLEAADIDRDGFPEIFAACQTAEGPPEIVAYRTDGSVLFRHRFDRFPGGPPRWNTGGLLRWMSGRFSATDTNDLLVTLRRTVMHTDESVLLTGPEARELWWCDDVMKRGCGGSSGAVGDTDADGLDEIVMQYPDLHFVLDGAAGDIESATSWPHHKLGGWSAYASPVLYDADRNGALETYSGNCRYTVARWSMDGQLGWHTPYLDGSSAMPALGDADGDGRFELVIPAYTGGIRCYAPLDGTLRWTWDEVKNATDVLAVDLDGDGTDEFVFGVGNDLIALTEQQGAPSLFWRLTLDERPYAPIAADTDGDGFAEILMMTHGGSLVCIDGAKQ